MLAVVGPGAGIHVELPVLLAAKGKKDAHGIVKKITLQAEKEKRSILDIIRHHSDFTEIVNTDSWKKLEENPSNYTGKSRERALAISYIWKSRVEEMKKVCADHEHTNYFFERP